MAYKPNPLSRGHRCLQQGERFFHLFLRAFAIGSLDHSLPGGMSLLQMGENLTQEGQKVIDQMGKQPKAREGESHVLDAMVFEKIGENQEQEAFPNGEFHPGSDQIAIEKISHPCENLPKEAFVCSVELMLSNESQEPGDNLGRVGVGRSRPIALRIRQ
jgi:hypothetical protein